MRYSLFCFLLMAFCSCHRSNVPHEFKDKTLHVQLYETSDGTPSSGAGAWVTARTLKTRTIMTTSDSSGQTECRITQISSAGVEIDVRMRRADTSPKTNPVEKEFSQKILVPYDSPVRVTLLPNICFEGNFESHM